MRIKHTQVLLFMFLVFIFFELKASNSIDEETIISIKGPSNGVKEDIHKVRIIWKGYERHLEQWGFKQYSSMQSEPFSWEPKQNTKMIYVDVGWSVIYDNHLNRPLPIIYTTFICDCVGIGIREYSCLHELQKVGMHNRYHVGPLDDLSNFLSAFSSERSKISLVSGYASEHLKSVLHFISELGFKDIELYHSPCISWDGPIDEDVSRSFLFPQKPPSLDGDLFDPGDLYQSLGFCPKRESFFLRESKQGTPPNIEEFDPLERILEQAKEDSQITLGWDIKAPLKH